MLESVSEGGAGSSFVPKWMESAVTIDMDLSNQSCGVDRLGLSGPLVAKLRENKIEYFFPVQRHVVPLLLTQGLVSTFHPGDICVSAPTGSGKTLSFVLPIVHTLSTRVVARLRALVVLPTNELAVQVKSVFDDYTTGTTDLKVVLSINSVSPLDNCGIKTMDRMDILVCTPSKLVEHIQFTEGFSARHLRYLIIDEADQMTGYVHDDWLAKLYAHIYAPAPGILSGVIMRNINELCEDYEKVVVASSGLSKRVRQEPSHLSYRARSDVFNVAQSESIHVPLQKLLFSATLSRNPEKIEKFELVRPHLITACRGAMYVTPHGLAEYIVHCSSTMSKLAALVHLLTTITYKKLLLFTSSPDSVHRLSQFLQLMVNSVEGTVIGSVAGFTHNLTMDERDQLLQRFRQGAVRVLVCTDGLARGMDIAQIDTVVSYEAPNYLKGYIHRAGRTARANNKGASYTLTDPDEALLLKRLLTKTHDKNITHITYSDELLSQYDNDIARTLTSLKQALNTTPAIKK